MNCDEFRDRAIELGGELGAEESAHVDGTADRAACVSCAAWFRTEMNVMSELTRAGEAWREDAMADRVMEKVGTAGVTPGAAKRPGHVGRVARIAAAAGLLAAAGVAVWMMQTPSSASAMSVMVAKLKNAGTVSFTMESPTKLPPSGRMLVRGQDMRMELASGEVVVSNASTGELAFLRPAQKQMMMGNASQRPFGLYDTFLSLARMPRLESLGREMMNGRMVEGFRGPMPEALDGLTDEIATVWIDVATRLPARVEIPIMVMNDRTKVVFRDFVFDEPVTEEMFDASPEGYTRVEAQADTPGIGIQIGVRARNLGMAFHMYLSAHNDQPPDRIEDLAPYVEKDGLRNPRRASEPVGFEYLKPELPLKYDRVLLYERFAEGAEKIWVVRVDSSAHVLTRAEFEKAMAGQARADPSAEQGK